MIVSRTLVVLTNTSFSHLLVKLVLSRGVQDRDANPAVWVNCPQQHPETGSKQDHEHEQIDNVVRERGQRKQNA